MLNELRLKVMIFLNGIVYRLYVQFFYDGTDWCAIAMSSSTLKHLTRAHESRDSAPLDAEFSAVILFIASVTTFRPAAAVTFGLGLGANSTAAANSAGHDCCTPLRAIAVAEKIPGRLFTDLAG